MQDRLFYIGQKAVINKKGEVLILHDPDIDKIDLPGGKIQEGEKDFIKSLQREVMEETGLNIKVGRPFDTSYFEFAPDSTSRNRGKKIFLVIFECEYLEGEVKISAEHDWYKWVDKKSYRKYFKKGNILRILASYFKVHSGNENPKVSDKNDPLLPAVFDYLNKFDFPLAYLIQRKFKIGFSRAERILKQLEARKSNGNRKQ